MIALERLFDNSPASRNFETLRRLVLDPGGVTAGIRFGLMTVTWPGGAALSNAATAAHGLGTTPIAAFASPNSQTGTGACCFYIQFDATNVTVNLETNGGAFPANTAVTPTSWLVIG